MFKELVPRQYVKDIFEININDLLKAGVRGIATDLDNTLVPWNSGLYPLELQHWVKELKDKGFKICLVSNNSASRDKGLTETLDIPAVWRSGKPKKRAYLTALDIMGLKPSEAAMIGDQIFTDIQGANRVGMYTVLVKPINKREFFFTKFKRPPEKFVLFMLRRKGIL